MSYRLDSVSAPPCDIAAGVRRELLVGMAARVGDINERHCECAYRVRLFPQTRLSTAERRGRKELEEVMITALEERDLFEIAERGTEEGIEEARAVEMLEARGGSIGVGPIRFEYDIDFNPPAARVSVHLLSVKLGSVVLTPARASASVSGNAGLAKASVSLTADFAKTEVRYAVRACVRSWTGWKCTSSQGTLVNW